MRKTVDIAIAVVINLRCNSTFLFLIALYAKINNTAAIAFKLEYIAGSILKSIEKQ